MKVKKIFPKTDKECEDLDCAKCGYRKTLFHTTKKGNRIWDGYKCTQHDK